MPVRIVGMIGVTPPDTQATLHVIEGGLSSSYLVQIACAHDHAGFDLALVGYTSSPRKGSWSRFTRRRKQNSSATL